MASINQQKARQQKRMLEAIRAKNSAAATEPTVVDSTIEPVASEETAKLIDGLTASVKKQDEIIQELKAALDNNTKALRNQTNEQTKPQEMGFFKAFLGSAALTTIGQEGRIDEFLKPKEDKGDSEDSSNDVAVQEEQLNEQNLLIEKGTKAQEAQVTKLDDNSKLLTSIDKNILELKDLVKENGMGGGGGTDMIGSLKNLSTALPAFASGLATAAAGVAAVAAVGTAAYALVKFMKGEDASNWISNIGDKITQAVTGDEKTSTGSAIYDAVDTVKGWFGNSDKDKNQAIEDKAAIDVGKKRLEQGKTVSAGLAEKLKKAGIEVRDDQITPGTKGPAQKSISEQTKSAVPVGPKQAVQDISAGNSDRKVNLEARRAMKGAVSADTARTLSDQETIMTEAGKRYGALVGDKNADPKKVAEAKKAYEKEQAAYNSMKDFNDENEEVKGPAQQAVQSQMPDIGNINVSFSEATFAQNDPENFQKYQDFKNETAKQLLKQASEKGNVTRGQREELALKAKIIAIKKFEKEARAAGALTDKQGKQMGSSLAGTPTPAKDAVAQQAIPISAAAAATKTSRVAELEKMLADTKAAGPKGDSTRAKQAHEEKIKMIEKEIEKEKSSSGVPATATQSVSGTLQGYVPDKEEWKKRTQEKLAAYPESMRNDPITKREARDDALMEMKAEAIKNPSKAQPERLNNVSQTYVDPNLADSIAEANKKAPPIVVPVPQVTEKQPPVPVTPERPYAPGIRNDENSVKGYVKRRYNPGMAT